MHAKGAGASEKGARRAKVGATISAQQARGHKGAPPPLPSQKAANNGGNSNPIATQ